jgi:hypothetical protein
MVDVDERPAQRAAPCDGSANRLPNKVWWGLSRLAEPFDDRRGRQIARMDAGRSSGLMARPSSRHCGAPHDMALEAKISRHVAVAIPIVTVGGVIAVSLCYQGA